MKRQCGRHPNKEYYLEIERLPDDELFSPTEITKRKYDKKSQNELFTKMFHAIYQFGFRNGLSLFPDNAVRGANGKPVMENGRAKLEPGVRSARWLGATWKSHLYADDHEAIKKYAQVKLTRTLRLILHQKLEQTERKGEPMPEEKAPRTTFLPRWKLLVAALVVGMLLTAGGVYNHSFLKQGLHVLRSDGAQAAWSFFQNRGESWDNMAGAAWAAYRKGDYLQSEELSAKLRESSSPTHQARAAYILGLIQTTRGKTELAEESLLEALAFYQSLNHSGAQYRTILALSRVFLNAENIKKAEYYINLAEIRENAWRDEYFLYLKSQMAFLKSDYDTALHLAKMRQELLPEENAARLMGVYADIGFYSCLVGDDETCLNYTLQAQALATQLGAKKNGIYNQINMCVYLKCQFKDYSHLQQKIVAYAMEHQDAMLMKYMLFVEKFSCPLERPDPGDPYFPDDPPPDTPPPAASQIIQPIHEN